MIYWHRWHSRRGVIHLAYRLKPAQNPLRRPLGEVGGVIRGGIDFLAYTFAPDRHEWFATAPEAIAWVDSVLQCRVGVSDEI